MAFHQVFTSVRFITLILILFGLLSSPSLSEAATIHLSWFATGDDYWEGTATSYEIRYRDTPMTEADFFDATLCDNIPVPDTSGTYQEIFITGLEQGQEYWIGLQSYDEALNPSGITIYQRIAQPINSPRIGGWR